MKRAVRDRSGEVVFVAHAVGGLGGMERQTAHLVAGLLDAGWTVTVIARTCKLSPRTGLRFVRVGGPRRPFTLAYPAFAVVAMIRAARRGDALLHTTGAIVANRTDVSSVHYCHRAARAALGSPRAARANPMYRMNATVAAWLAAAGESWCYRPQRARVLCAVSQGVARELDAHFPSMGHAVRTVPNGVDISEFKPDLTARRELRARLGIRDGACLALFAGGDWQRKGLRHAVEGLTLAPNWHLAVAGDGDRQALSGLAAEERTEGRLHFLGQVQDMPRVYASADAFVFPTAYEAFPLAMLEAAASGVPLLVTRVSGAEDLLEDGSNGWFISPDAGDIARRLNQLAGDLSLARRMGEAARVAAAEFTWETAVEGYLAVYSELARHAARRKPESVPVEP